MALDPDDRFQRAEELEEACSAAAGALGQRVGSSELAEWVQRSQIMSSTAG